MTIYAVIRKSDLVEVYRYMAPAPMEWVGMKFTDYNHVALVDAETPPPVTPVQVKISRLAFITRFTDAEAVALDLSSQGATVKAASMRRYMQKVNAAEFIDLNRPDTRIGVQTLEAVGLLAPGRSIVILDTPLTESEVYRG